MSTTPKSTLLSLHWRTFQQHTHLLIRRVFVDEYKISCRQICQRPKSCDPSGRNAGTNQSVSQSIDQSIKSTFSLLRSYKCIRTTIKHRYKKNITQSKEIQRETWEVLLHVDLSANEINFTPMCISSMHVLLVVLLQWWHTCRPTSYGLVSNVMWFTLNQNHFDDVSQEC